MLAKRTYKNQITIPKEIVDQTGNIDYFDVSYEQGVILLKPVEIKNRGERLGQIRKKIKALGLNEGDISKAIQQTRAKIHS